VKDSLRWIESPLLPVASSMKRPVFGSAETSPYERLIRSHFNSTAAIKPRTSAVPVSMEPRRESPILTETIWAPGATPKGKLEIYEGHTVALWMDGVIAGGNAGHVGTM
jgi:hypothetical protein